MEYRTTRLFVLATSLLFIALLFLPATLINARQPQTPAPTPTPIGEVEGRGCGSTRVGLQSDQADDGVCDCTLEISQMSSSSFVEGEPGSYQMRLTNVGDMPIDGLTVENNWSNDLQFVSAMGNGWFCQSYGSQTFCDNPSKLMPGSSSTFTMTVGVRPHAPDQIDHCAVLHIEGDNNALNNSSCIETAVERSPSYPIGSTEITVTAGLSATLAYTHPLKALTTQIAIPSGFTSETTLVSYTELLTPTYANALDRTPDVKQFAGRAFIVSAASVAGIYQPDFVPQQPMTVSLQFDPASLAEPIETADLPGYLERSLRLYFMDEISGRWTDTMTSSLTITPVNDLFEVSLPVDRMAEFALVIVEPSGTQTSVTPDEGGRFAFTNAQSLTTGIQFPPDAVDTTVTVSYTEQSEPTQQEQLEALEEVEQFAGRSFRLDVLDGLGRLQPGFVFAEPMSMTIQVDPTTISTTTNLLKRLRVYRFNPTEKLWEDLADDPIVTWHGDVIEIETAASRAAEFAVVLVNIQTPGEGTALVYLPMIQR